MHLAGFQVVTSGKCGNKMILTPGECLRAANQLNMLTEGYNDKVSIHPPFRTDPIGCHVYCGYDGKRCQALMRKGWRSEHDF